MNGELRNLLQKRDMARRDPEKRKKEGWTTRGKKEISPKKIKFIEYSFHRPSEHQPGFVFKDISRNLNYECLHHWSIRLFGR